MHGMPQACRGGVPAISSNWFQACSLRIASCISRMIEVRKCFGKGFGWICALNRWSVPERAQTSFCPIARQVLHYLAWELCRQIAAWILSKVAPFYLCRGFGGWVVILGRRPKIWTCLSTILFLDASWLFLKKCNHSPINIDSQQLSPFTLEAFHDLWKLGRLYHASY